MQAIYRPHSKSFERSNEQYLQVGDEVWHFIYNNKKTSLAFDALQQRRVRLTEKWEQEVHRQEYMPAPSATDFVTEAMFAA